MAKAKVGLMEVFKELLTATVRLCLLTQDRPTEPQPATLFLNVFINHTTGLELLVSSFLEESLPTLRDTPGSGQNLVLFGAQNGHSLSHTPSITVQ